MSCSFFAGLARKEGEGCQRVGHGKESSAPCWCEWFAEEDTADPVADGAACVRPRSGRETMPCGGSDSPRRQHLRPLRGRTQPSPSATGFAVCYCLFKGSTWSWPASQVTLGERGRALPFVGRDRGRETRSVSTVESVAQPVCPIRRNDRFLP